MTFIPDISVIAAFSLAAAFIALTPGPDMTLFISRALSQGKPAGYAAMIGAMSGLVIHTILIAFGISILIATSQTAFMVLKFVGAGYLLWLGYQAIRNSSSLIVQSTISKPSTWFENWLTGLTINLLNPKIVIFFITFLPQFVDAQDPHATGKLLFLGACFIIIGITICAGIIYAAAHFVETLRKKPLISRMINYSFAGVFAAFAIKILATERL